MPPSEGNKGDALTRHSSKFCLSGREIYDYFARNGIESALTETKSFAMRVR